MSRLSLIVKDIEERVARDVQDLRKSSDWADFQRRSGIITGLEKTIGIINERRQTPEEGDTTDA